MRKIYILSHEEDGRVGEVILDQGLDPDTLENPVCPRCGSETLLAYAHDDDYTVVTWDSLAEEEEEATPDAWYLICQDFHCPYEEQVERVHDPGEAELFDLHRSSWVFEEETVPTGGHPAGLKELIAYLEEVRETHPHRKLDALLDDAHWCYNEAMNRIRRWVKQVPLGRKIHLGLYTDAIKATFIMATEERILVQTLPEGEMVGIGLEEISAFRPLSFLDDDEPKQPQWPLPPDSVISIFPSREYIVVRSFHLRLSEVDRFGLFHISSEDPAAARVLGLKPESEGYWRGHFGRRDIESRYAKKRMVRAKGYWFEVYGETNHSRSPAVFTENPAAAAALGLRPWPRRPGDPEPDQEPGIQRWNGVIPIEQVEERDEVTVYLWPIPELKDAD
ncbi:MAG: hypothetical protein ACOY94_29335 [Bacillota bacterium]